MTINAEGPESAQVQDSTKIRCTYCGGVKFSISNLMDDPNDITQATDFAALLLTISGGSFQGLVALCLQCGHQQVPMWYLIDTGASNGTTITMGDLDQATTANLMAGLYMIYLGDDANDAGKYFIVGTNTAAVPTVITPTVSPHADSDGEWMITNILPLGRTLAT